MLPTFPVFAKLTLDDKQKYNSLIAEYPPISDISFTSLHIWWNLDGKLSISSLNNNLVINYSLPFDKENSGYSLIGKNLVDESIQTILEHLRPGDQVARLVHVPEFVTTAIQHKERLHIEEEPDYNEYILDSKALASLEGSDHARTRRKVNRFLRELEDSRIEIKSLDLSLPEIREMLLKSVVEWNEKYPSENDPDLTEHQAIQTTLAHSVIFETKNLCFFVDEKLHGFVLYHQPIDKNYYIINHLKVDYGIPFIFDYVTNQLAIKALEQGVTFLNMEMDLGIEGLRMHKMGLRPVSFFKKYTITAN